MSASFLFIAEPMLSTFGLVSVVEFLKCLNVRQVSKMDFEMSNFFVGCTLKESLPLAETSLEAYAVSIIVPRYMLYVQVTFSTFRGGVALGGSRNRPSGRQGSANHPFVSLA